MYKHFDPSSKIELTNLLTAQLLCKTEGAGWLSNLMNASHAELDAWATSLDESRSCGIQSWPSSDWSGTAWLTPSSSASTLLATVVTLASRWWPFWYLSWLVSGNSSRDGEPSFRHNGVYNVSSVSNIQHIPPTSSHLGIDLLCITPVQRTIAGNSIIIVK